MADAPSRSVDLPRVVELAAQLHEDEAATSEARLERDRRIAAAQALPADRLGRLSAWLAQAAGEEARRAAHRAASIATVAGLLVVGLGFVAGGSTAAAVFAYSGATPVNITWILAVFVGIQAAVLVLTVLAMIPQRLPGVAAIQRALVHLSPGRLGPVATRFIPDAQRQKLEPVLGRIAGSRLVYSRLGRWWVLSLGQTFGVSFHLAALAVAIALITTTDLAFGWSTTLDIDAELAHRITRAVALPWAWAWPAASPDLPLIESTRFFRMEGLGGAAAPVMRGRWWPFAVMAMVTYGLIPRLAMMAIARWRLGAAARWTFTNLPGVPVVLARLADRAEPPPAHGLGADPAPGRVASGSALAAGAVAVAWSDPPRVAGLGPAVDASGADPASALAAVREQLADRPDAALLIVSRAWEPPVAELFDFIAELRSATSQTHPVLLLPVSFAEDGKAAAASDTQLDLWRRRAAKAADPWLAVVGLEEVAP